MKTRDGEKGEELGACFIVSCVCVKVRGKWHLPTLRFSDFGHLLSSQSPDVPQMSSDVRNNGKCGRGVGFGVFA